MMRERTVSVDPSRFQSQEEKARGGMSSSRRKSSVQFSLQGRQRQGAEHLCWPCSYLDQEVLHVLYLGVAIEADPSNHRYRSPSPASPETAWGGAWILAGGGHTCWVHPVHVVLIGRVCSNGIFRNGQASAGQLAIVRQWSWPGAPPRAPPPPGDSRCLILLLLQG